MFSFLCLRPLAMDKNLCNEALALTLLLPPVLETYFKSIILNFKFECRDTSSSLLICLTATLATSNDFYQSPGGSGASSSRSLPESEGSDDLCRAATPTPTSTSSRRTWKTFSGKSSKLLKRKVRRKVRRKSSGPKISSMRILLSESNPAFSLTLLPGDLIFLNFLHFQNHPETKTRIIHRGRNPQFRGS